MFELAVVEIALLIIICILMWGARYIDKNFYGCKETVEFMRIIAITMFVFGVLLIMSYYIILPKLAS